MYYTELIFRECDLSNGDTFAEIYLNHQRSSNSLSLTMIRELVSVLERIESSNHRFLIITGAGKNFCSGADLRWMKENKSVGQAQITSEAKVLAKFFSKFHELELPVLGVVKGVALGGAVGIVACCDYTIATSDAQFGLSEARLGLIPAVIMPYIAKKFSKSGLLRACLTGGRISAQEAMLHGLVSKLVEHDNLENAVQEEINQLLQCSLQAQKQAKRLFRNLYKNNFQNKQMSIDALVKARSSQEAKAGIEAFFAKTPPPWAVKCEYTRTEYVS